MKSTYRKRSFVGWGAMACGLLAVNCDLKLPGSEPSTAGNGDEGGEQVASVTQRAQMTGTLLWQDEFDYLRAKSLGSSASGKDWWFQTYLTDSVVVPNGEAQRYSTRVCDNAATKTYASENVDTGSYPGVNDTTSTWNYCVESNADGEGDSKQLRIRAIERNNQVTSGRLNSKGLRQFQPTAGTGIQIKARIKLPPHGNHSWPAWWLLQSRLAESPFLGNGDTVSWPCEGAHEIDIMEVGAVWPSNYNKSSMHFNNGACEPQIVEGTLSRDITDNRLTDGNWHVYTLELETDKARFFLDSDSTPYGGEINTAGYKFEIDPWFMILNYAIGGALGGTDFNPSTSTWYEGGGRSLYMDYVKVYSFTPGGGGAPTGYRNIANNLEADDSPLGYDAMSGLQFENCTEGGRNAGWIEGSDDQNNANDDWIEWKIAVPSTGQYQLDLRSSINAGSAAVNVWVDGTWRLYKSMTPAVQGWQNWQTHTTSAFNLSQGNHTIKVQFLTASQNLNWVKLKAAAAAETCTDGVQNQNETATDCGGVCAPCGTTGVGVRYQAESAAALSHNTAPHCSSTSMQCTTHLGWWDPGKWAQYSGVNLGGVGGMKLRYASGSGGQTIRACVGAASNCDSNTNPNFLGEVVIPNTGGWASWKEDIYLNFTKALSGNQTLYLKALSSNGGAVLDLDWFELVAKTQDSGTGSGASCTNNIQDGTESGVDCGGSCPNACATTIRLQAEDATMSGAGCLYSTEPGFSTGSGRILQSASCKMCWSGVNMGAKTKAILRYASGEGNDTVRFNYPDGTARGTLALSATPGWKGSAETNGIISFGATSGTGTACVDVSAGSNWIMGLDYVDIQ